MIRLRFIIQILFILIISVQTVYASLPNEEASNNNKAQNIESDADIVYKLIDSAGYYFNSDVELTIKLSLEALEMAKKSKDDQLIFSSQLAVGQAEWHNAEIEKAYDYFNNALDIAKKMGDIYKEAQVSFLLGQVYLEVEDYIHAKENFENALDFMNIDPLSALNNEYPDTLLVAYIYNYLGVINSGLNRNSEANYFFNKSIDIASNVGDTIAYIGILNNAGKYFNYNDKAHKAIEILTMASKLSRITNTLYSACYSHRYLAEAYQQIGNNDSALFYYKRGISLAEEYNHKEIIYDISLELCNYYIDTEQKDSAIKYFTIHQKYSNILNLDERKENIAKEHIVKKIRAINVGYKAQIFENIRLFILITVLTLLIAGVIILLISKHYRQRKKADLNTLQSSLDNTSAELSQIKTELLEKNRRLATNVMYHIKDMEHIDDIKNKIKDLEKSNKSVEPNELQSVYKKLSELEKQHNWEEFEKLFLDINPDFYNTLISSYPDLTLNDRKIAAFLYLGLTTKEIAQISIKSVRSIEIARHRLRKKLNLNKTDSISNFLMNLNNNKE